MSLIPQQLWSMIRMSQERRILKKKSQKIIAITEYQLTSAELTSCMCRAVCEVA